MMRAKKVGDAVKSHEEKKDVEKNERKKDNNNINFILLLLCKMWIH